MKKSELKNIIKECVKEVIFEEGVLSGIITEVASGLQSSALMEHQHPQIAPTPRTSTQEQKREVLNAIGNNSYDDLKKKFKNPGLFEGTKPLPREGKQGSALAGVAPNDPGVDISQLPGMGNWSSIAKG